MQIPDTTRYISSHNWGWYRLQVEQWRRYVHTCQPVKVLEIGAFNGASANLMLDVVFTHPESEIHTIDSFTSDPTTLDVNRSTRQDFHENCSRGGYGRRIRLYEGRSTEVLAGMISNSGSHPEFDVIFIDGSHLAKDVLTDATLAWPLLKPGGLLIFDDYEWGGSLRPHMRPKESIDAFAAAFIVELVPVHAGVQRIFRKVGIPYTCLDRNLSCQPSKQCVIIGTYLSGASILSQVMETLGFYIGRPLWEPYFESATFREKTKGSGLFSVKKT